VKGLIIMADTLPTGQNAIDAWNKLLENAMKAYPAPSTPVGPAQAGGKDPWTALLEQFWHMNPYSKLVPVEPAEAAECFALLSRDRGIVRCSVLL
jgi:hypothetical protein